MVFVLGLIWDFFCREFYIFNFKGVSKWEKEKEGVEEFDIGL